MLVTWYDFLCHSDVTSLPPLYRYPLSIAWLRVRVARYTHPVYSPSGSCHSDVTSLPPLYRYPLSIARLRVRVARYTFLFSLAWLWRMNSLVKHNMLILWVLVYIVALVVRIAKHTFSMPLYIVKCGLSGSPHYLTNGVIFVSLNITWVFWFPLQNLVWKMLHSEKNSAICYRKCT